MEYIVLSIYFLVILFISTRAAKKIKNSDDFYAAGKKAGSKSVMGSLLATILGGSAVIGTVNFSTTHGWASAWFMICAALGLLALIPFVSKARKFANYTITELIGNFYGSQARKFANILIPIAWTGVTAAQIIAAGKILNAYAGIDYTFAALGAGIIFITYTIVGGQKSIVRTDALQAIWLIAALVLIFIYVLLFKPASLETVSIPEFPFNSTFSAFDLIMMLFTYSTTFLVGPDIYSRIFCAGSDQKAQKALLVSASVLIPMAFLLAFLGTQATSIFPNEAFKSQSALVLLVKTVLPHWAVGIVIVGLLSAVMSSADSILLTAASLFSDLRGKDLKDKSSIRHTRYSILGIGIISIVISLWYSNVIGIFLLALAVFSGAFIVPVLFGLMGYKIRNNTFAITAMITGAAMAFIGKVLAINGYKFFGDIFVLSAFFTNGIILLLPLAIRKLRLAASSN